MKRDRVSIWIMSVVVLIISMVCIGGITRLTGSGLSITEWKPILGAIPPLNQAEWEMAFEKYKQIPQFQVLNSSMELAEFKGIYFWEYFHRLIGRLLGFVVFVPGLWWIFRKRLERKYALKVGWGFVLGGLQGLLGWIMVKSGLSELVYVSHLRLAAHLLLALFILSYWFDLYLEWNSRNALKPSKPVKVSPSQRRWTRALALVLVPQLTYGAFVAGLKAGVGYNTFPQMNGEWVPSAFFALTPTWINFFDNQATVQFIHRWLAVILVSLAVIFFVRFKGGRVFLLILMAQFALGVLTLLMKVPLVLASLHQITACLLVLALTQMFRSSRS